MSRLRVTLSGPTSRAKAVSWIAEAPDGWRVEVREPRRSDEQNRLLWLRLSDIGRQVEWYGQKLTGEDWKDIFTASLRRARVVPGLDPGSYVPLGMRTSSMGVREMSDLLELIAAFGAQHGVVFTEDAGREAQRSSRSGPGRAGADDSGQAREEAPGAPRAVCGCF